MITHWYLEPNSWCVFTTPRRLRVLRKTFHPFLSYTLASSQLLGLQNAIALRHLREHPAQRLLTRAAWGIDQDFLGKMTERLVLMEPHFNLLSVLFPRVCLYWPRRFPRSGTFSVHFSFFDNEPLPSLQNKGISYLHLKSFLDALPKDIKPSGKLSRKAIWGRRAPGGRAPGEPSVPCSHISMKKVNVRELK